MNRAASAAGTATTGLPLGLTVRPLTPLIGAEISGLNLSIQLNPEIRDELHRLLHRHRVLFFRDQHLDPRRHIEFAEAFGSILRFRSVVPTNSQHPEVHDVDGSTVGWHIDASAMVEPPVATVLRAVELPSAGGDTIWANGVAAYEGLPPKLRQRVDGLYATHTAPADHPFVAHPVVCVHPETNERYLYVNLAPWVNTRILGMGAAESAALISTLRSNYLRPQYQVRFRWSIGAVVMWDNRVTQHTGIKDYGADVPRRLGRICIARFHQH